jgi:hypothetical protein
MFGLLDGKVDGVHELAVAAPLVGGGDLLIGGDRRSAEEGLEELRRDHSVPAGPLAPARARALLYLQSSSVGRKA